MAPSSIVSFICLYVFAKSNLADTASILQDLNEAYVSWMASYYYVKTAHNSAINFKPTHNASRAVSLQPKSSLNLSESLTVESQEKLQNNTNGTYLTQIFHVGQDKREKRNAVNLMTTKSKRYKKFMTENEKTPRKRKSAANGKGSRGRRRKSKRRRKGFSIPLPYPNSDLNRNAESGNTTSSDAKRGDGGKSRRRKNRKRHSRKTDMPLPFPNGSSLGVEDISNATNNNTITAEETFTSQSEIPNENPDTNIGVNTNEAEGQFVISVTGDDFPKVKRVKRHKVKKVNIPLPFNTAPKVMSKESQKPTVVQRTQSEKPKVVKRTKRHRKHQRKRPPPLV